MLIPSTLVLPYYARPDLAWIDSFDIPLVAPGFSLCTYTPSSGYIDLVLAFICQFQTTAGAGNRLMVLEFFTPSGPTKFYNPASLTQGPSLTYNYSFFLDGANSSQSGNNGGVTSMLPAIPMMPGDRMQFRVNDSVGADAFTQQSISVMHIPTGPPNHNPDESPIQATEQALLPASAFV